MTSQITKEHVTSVVGQEIIVATDMVPGNGTEAGGQKFISYNPLVGSYVVDFLDFSNMVNVNHYCGNCMEQAVDRYNSI